MAAHGNNFIRVRLNFDYPPPSVADCRMCWLLVDLNGCRVVADLESVIREKFEFGRGSILSLFVEDCYLPHTESVYVVRDNDSVRVKVDCLAQANGPSSCPDTSESSRKRRRPAEEDGPGENQVSVEWKKKKRKKRSEDSLETVGKDTVQASGDEKKESQGKKKKKKKKTKKAKEMSLTVTPKPAASPKKNPVSVLEQPLKSTKKPPVAKPLSSSDSSSSSSEESTKKPATQKPTAPKPATQKPTAPKPAPKIPSSSPAAASKTPPTTKPKMVKLHPPSSSSSDSDSSSDEAVPKKNTPMTPKGRTPAPKSQQALPALQSTNSAQKQAAGVAAPPHDETAQPSGSDSDEEIKLVIRRPMQQPLLGAGSHPSWRGRGQTWRGGPREGRGGGRGVRGPSSSFESTYNGAQEPSCLTDSLTNVSVVLQNGARAAPKRDYSSMPLLAAPPQVGQKIAFKLLELTENYTPEVSEYKEGKIVSLDLANKQIELELLSASRAPVEPGKFDLVYQNADGSESVEYAVSRGSRVTERWESLLEPRLVI